MHTLPLPEVTDNKQQTKIEDGNSKAGYAQNAPRTSNFDLRVSAPSPHLTSQQLQFLLRVTPSALESERVYEVPACVSIAQAILESATPKFGWGNSVLFRVANNPFGIKHSHFSTEVTSSAVEKVEKVKEVEKTEAAKPLTLSTFSTSSTVPEPYGEFDATTWEIENGQKKVIMAQFARFPNLDEAFRAHALLLRAPRYRPAFAVHREWKQFAERLGPKASPMDMEHCGYSTNPSYSAELIKLVSLYRLDDPRAVEWYATGEDPGMIGTPDSGLGSLTPKPEPTAGRGLIADL